MTDSRYFGELNFGYNGSERFAKKNRWGFFPSIGAGYIISNEHFYPESWKKVMNKLKLKATYGLVGNDAIGNTKDRFFYLSNVNVADAGKNIAFESIPVIGILAVVFRLSVIPMKISHGKQHIKQISALR